MPKAYVILTEAIHDQETMDRYGRESARALVEFGGKPLIVDSNPIVLEGEWHGNRTVVVEYESVEAAKAWYESAAYQETLPLRLAASQCNVVICTGFEMPKRPA